MAAIIHRLRGAAPVNLGSGCHARGWEEAGVQMTANHARFLALPSHNRDVQDLSSEFQSSLPNKQ